MTAGANPQHTVLVLVKARNVIAGQSVFPLAPGGEFSTLEKIQAAAFGADPEISARILRDGAHDVLRENVRPENFRAGSGDKMICLEQKQPVVPRPDPNFLLTVHQRFPGILMLPRVKVLRGIAGPVRHAKRAKRHPQTAGHILRHRLRRPRMKFGGRVKSFPLDPIQAAAVGSHPKIAVAIQAQGKDIRRR